MTKEMKRPISNITQDSIKPLLSNAVEFYTNKNREAHKCIQERDEYINYLESKLSNAKPQQALPVVPECVAGSIEWDEQIDNSIEETLKNVFTCGDRDLKEAGLWVKNNPEKYIIARNIGYTVEKPQLFKLIFPNSTAVLQKDGELNSFADTVYKRYLIENAMTEQEIKSIDERYWQFAVPVEDGE
ncbi:DUF1642 domain-containing protein [Lactococcus lactis]|uniref:DUF1642 domain-containing protein n=1 Tax=Lactococcus lactis TaxID=1358 RepID=UPI0004E19CC0|nr:DUF1642 domain-containing protein [Lactococcus lactis]OJH47561.1 hypothetical protein LGL2_04925 [Lactococcus lactis subsp. lactis bv. diacetylactis]